MDIIKNKKLNITMATLLLISIGMCLSGNTLAANATTAQLAAETAARRAADTAERNARTAADNGLNTGLTTEKNARIAADAAESTARATADTAESAARTVADTALQHLIETKALPPLPATRFQAALTLCGNSDTLQWGPCHYVIGDTGPAGGIVFYITDGGLHGLEAAPVDQGNAEWGCDGTPITGADNHTVGSGAQNTRDILAGCSNVAGIAAKVADDYTLNSYSDWFLPSIDELTFMWANIGQGAAAPLTNVGHFVADGIYWSSSESADVSNLFAWAQVFNQSGRTDQLVRYFGYSVRAIRAF